MTLWSKRMRTPPAKAMMEFTESLSFDRLLWRDDLDGSIAHVRGLEHTGVLDEADAAKLIAALGQVGEEFSAGRFEFADGDEDIHTAIERRVTEIAGDAGAKLHTARSRNDQVATALRLYVRRRIGEVAGLVLDLGDTLRDRAARADGITLPGYTHLQRAQPVALSNQLLAHGWALARDVDRLFDTRRRTDVSPLGAGALTGSSLLLDPGWVAGELGFAGRFENSLDAVADRDFVAETLFDLALVGVHLSRLGEEVVVFSTAEFGYYHLDDAWSTGSSMLPQKKNPDIAELARGKTGRLIGHLAGFLATLKGLPFAYNRDLQEDKEPLFDAFDQVSRALVAMRGLVETVRFDEEAMKKAVADPALYAVDLAEWLVERGMPFRRAHGLVGDLVRRSVEESKPLAELVVAEPALGRNAVPVVQPDLGATTKPKSGPAGRGDVAGQLERFAGRLRADRARLGEIGHPAR
ncbi:MAG: argininosuccinate lyase [Acidimicrobiales bacterium]